MKTNQTITILVYQQHIGRQEVPVEETQLFLWRMVDCLHVK